METPQLNNGIITSTKIKQDAPEMETMQHNKWILTKPEEVDKNDQLIQMTLETYVPKHMKKKKKPDIRNFMKPI
jgi:hypothetical protein